MEVAVGLHDADLTKNYSLKSNKARCRIQWQKQSQSKIPIIFKCHEPLFSLVTPVKRIFYTELK
jgi:hypothetical protein